MIRRFFPFAICLAALFGFVRDASAGEDAAELLRDVARATRNIRTVSASFHQEKRLDFLKKPLVSEGRMVYARAAGNGGHDLILWEYLEPAPSGFIYRNDHGVLWTRDKAKQRPVSGREAVLVHAMAEQILAWTDVQPDKLARWYAMERSGPASLRLTPRGKVFFRALDVTFSDDLRTVRSLVFTEDEGSTVLTFHDCALDVPIPSELLP